MNIYQKLNKVRVELQQSNLSKSGNNKFANFKYFTLDDFLPRVNELMNENGLTAMFNIDTIATLTIVNVEKPEERVEFTSPVAEAEIKGSTPIQCLGGVHTYLKRYLYLNAFEMVESDVLDALVGTDTLETEKKAKKQLNQKLVKEINALGGTLDQVASYFQVGVEDLTDKQLEELIARKKVARKNASI